MRVAILSDIHGNLLALEAVLDDLAATGGADAVIVAGDLCLGGPQPRETLARLRALGYPIVQGNTDRDLALAPAETAESDHAELLDWTRQQLAEDALAFLRALPFDHRVLDPTGAGSLQIVHANPQNLDDPLQPYSPDTAVAPLLSGLAPEVQALAFGHLHIPFAREFGFLLLANISSVGQPKDGDRRANYGLLQWADSSWSVEQRRVEYPVDEVVAQLREAAPPGADELIKTLLRARYPNMTIARGGRAPKRRTPARPAAVHDPRESEALVVQIGTNPARTTAVAEDVAAVEITTSGPIATQIDSDVEPQTTLGEGELASASQPEADTPAEVVTSDAELAETPLLPLADAPDEPTTDDAVEAVEAEPESDVVIIEDADLAWSDEDTDVPAIVAATARDESEAHTDAVGDGDGEDEKPKKQRRKKVRKAAKQAAEAESAQLTAGGSFALALPKLLDSRLAAVLAQLPGVRDDEDPEAIHDMRVATRRLRAALAAAEPFFGKDRFRTNARRVQKLAQALGEVRDADVLLAYLRKRYMAVADDERVGVQGLIDAIAAERAVARDDLDPVLDRWGDEGRLAAEFRRFVTKAKARGGKAKGDDRVAAVASRALDRDLERFTERAELLDDEGGSSEEFHDLRIAGKKLRYTIEFFTPALGADADSLLTSLKSLQELLGEIHDRDVLIDLLAWERARALERQLHSLEFTTFNPGTRDERLRATRQLLDAPDSFAATAIGTYGLLIDATMERDTLEEQLRGRWVTLQSEDFVGRLHQLAEALLIADEEPVHDEPEDASADTTTAE